MEKNDSESIKEKRKCPECNGDMKIIKGMKNSIPTSFDKEKKILTWSSCSPNIMKYKYWECLECRYIAIED